jgi:hypothetical protein
MLQAQVEVAVEIQRVKTAMARQAEKEVATLKKELAASQKKARDAEEDLTIIVEVCLNGPETLASSSWVVP